MTEDVLRLVRRFPDVDTVSWTVPLKPLRLVNVITLVVDEPLDILIVEGLADMEKSPVDEDDTVKVTDVEWDNEPLEPVTVTVYVPAGVVDCVEMESVELPVPPEDIARLDGLTDTVGPVGEEVAARLTDPEKPPVEATVMVDVPLEPATRARELGLEEIVKSGFDADWTLTLTVAL